MQSSVESRLRSTMAALAEKNTEKISVSSLCEKAGVSRASFYLYYNDIDDLIIKTREYIVNKLCDQLSIILDTECSEQKVYRLLFDEVDIALLKGYLGKHVYWEFAIETNKIIMPRYNRMIIERYGEDFYNERKEVFEFLLNGGVASLCLDLISGNKSECFKNMLRVREISRELLDC